MPKLGSDAALKNRLAGGGGGNLPIRRITAENSPLLVRFLDAPPEWSYYDAWFDEANKRTVILGEGERPPASKKGVRIFTRFMANVILPDDDPSVALVLEMPSSLAGDIGAQYLDKGGEGTGTAYILGRDFELFRKGTGKNDTKYSFAPEAPKKRNVSSLELHDLEEIIDKMSTPVESEADEDADDDEFESEEETEEEQVESEDEETEEEEEETEEEEAEEEEESGDDMPDFDSMSVSAIKAWIEEQGYEVPATKVKSKLVQEAVDVWEAEQGEPDEAEEDEDEGEAYTREELTAMRLAELKALAEDNGIDPTKYSKSNLIDLLMGEEAF